MPINLQGSGNIAEGWGPAPQLHAQDLSGMVSAILRNKLLREQQTRENIADTIKNVREERQSAEYLDAMKAAGLVPQDYDAGGLGGVKLGSELAKQIMAQKVADARAGEINAHTAYYNAKAANPYAPRRGGSSGSGGGGSAEPQTVWKDGIEWRPGPGGRWIPMKPAGTTKTGEPKLSPTERGWAAPEIPGVSVNINDPEGPGKLLPPDTAAMPEPAPAETGDALPTSKPQPTTGGTGTTDVIRLRQEANDAIARGADPAAVKAKFHDMTGGVL